MAGLRTHQRCHSHLYLLLLAMLMALVLLLLSGHTAALTVLAG